MKAQLTSSEIRYLKPLAKDYILLPTKYKEPLVTGWNKFGKSYYLEKRSIKQLLAVNQEYSLRTGKKVSSNYYFIAIDLDDLWAKERIKVSRYVQTARGIHRYIWIKELPKSCWLVNQSGNKLGEIHSLGRFVVGIGSIHKSGVRYSLKGANNLKWSLQFENLKKLQEFLKERGIFPTPWGKEGRKNIQDLEPYVAKFSPAQKYCQRKVQLEERVNQQSHPEEWNICYLCLVSYRKQPGLIKAHLVSVQHQRQWNAYQNRKTTLK